MSRNNYVWPVIGTTFWCAFELIFRVAQEVLGNVAIRAGGKKLEWDGPNMKFTNDSEADKFLRTEYREGWTL